MKHHAATTFLPIQHGAFRPPQDFAFVDLGGKRIEARITERHSDRGHHTLNVVRSHRSHGSFAPIPPHGAAVPPLGGWRRLERPCGMMCAVNHVWTKGGRVAEADRRREERHRRRRIRKMPLLPCHPAVPSPQQRTLHTAQTLISRSLHTRFDSGASQARLCRPCRSVPGGR